MTRKTRFTVLMRDHFTCRYCGRRPPKVELEVDHILPRSRGGGDSLNNLVTACYDCNRGKRHYLLGRWSEIVLRQPEDRVLDLQDEWLDARISIVEDAFDRAVREAYRTGRGDERQGRPEPAHLYGELWPLVESLAVIR